MIVSKMISVWLMAATAWAKSASTASGLAVEVYKNGSYTVLLNGKTWYASGPTFVHCENTLFTTENASLKLTKTTQSTGTDGVLGPYKETKLEWMAGSTPFVTSVQEFLSPPRAYGGDGSVVIFSQSFPNGAKDTSLTGNPQQDQNGIMSSWPAFMVDAPPPSTNTNSSDSLPDPRGFVTFSGRFLESSKGGAFDSDHCCSSGESTGPLAVFSKGSWDTVTFSPASNFMAGVMYSGNAEGHGNQKYIATGLMGSFTSVPVGFEYKSVLVHGTGLTATMKAWGTMLLNTYNNTRNVRDITLTELGFATDNGAFYYRGNTERLPNGTRVNYEQTLLDVQKYAASQNIPYKYWQLDSWWYFEGPGGGCQNWTARSNVFPDGLAGLYKRTGLVSQAHNRYWAPNVDYAKQNGGTYDFIVEPHMSIPNSQQFWDDLMYNASLWGMQVYEQDWLFTEFQGLNATLENATLGRDWLMQMGEGARKVNAGIQYCMSYPKHVLQSVEIPAVTQFRAGDDYGPGQSTNCHFPYCVYYIGTTSIVAWALDLAPAKDNFWSTTGNETDSPYSPSTHEPYSEMECAISAFSTGPVQPSDKIGFSNSSLILQACTTNGTLLQPSKPATTIDECFAQAAGFGTGPVATKEYNEPVMSTHSQVSGHKWVHVLSIGLNSSFDLYPRHVPLEMDSTATYIQYTRDDVPAYGGKVSLKEFSATSPMRLAPCLYTDFGVTYAAPVLGNGMAILGEMAKWVPLSPIRFRAIDEGAGGAVTITLAGAPNEVVHVATYHSGAITDTVCTLNADGMGTLNL
eukprot:m.526816 g.526816  ORF g.526816 m.526816 type:complete len:797 (-) comp22006_c0_seq1:232-2622(-)